MLWNLLSLLTVCVISLIRADESNPENVSSKLMVHVPHALYKEGGYGHREALFGFPRYGGAMVQNVYYADSDLCDMNVDTRGGYPHRSMDDDTGQRKPWQTPFILMVDRGSCTFVTKVRHAQRAGAAGVIIADNTCLCSDKECMMSQLSVTQCEPTEPTMADDGSGGDITIPSFLMFKHDADPVKDELKQNRPVQMEMAWKLPSPDNRVEYDLWTTPSDVVSKEFFQNFKKIAIALGTSAYFTLHMYIQNGARMGCQSANGESTCFNLCTNGGRYCANDPDGDAFKGASGGDVVRESLRRLCIWNKYGAQDGIGIPFWDYVAEFNEKCAAHVYPADDKCINDAYQKAKVDGKLVEDCVSDSGGTDRSVANNKLDDEIASQEQRGVVIIPTAFVNTAAIRGALTSTNVFAAICAGFMAGSTPDICTKCASCSDAVSCVESGFCKSNPTSGHHNTNSVSKLTYWTSLCFMIPVFTGLAVWHYKRTQDGMRDQVRGILAEYMPLDDQGRGQDGDGGAPGSPVVDLEHRGGVMTSLMS